MPSKRKSDLSRISRAIRLKKLASKKRRLEETKRQAFLRAAGTLQKSQLSEEYLAAYLASQTVIATSEHIQQKLQEQADDQEIIKADEMIEVTNAPGIENVQIMVHPGQSFSSRNIFDTKNVSESDPAIDNGSHRLLSRGLMNNKSSFCKALKSKEETLRGFCSAGKIVISTIYWNINILIS